MSMAPLLRDRLAEAVCDTLRAAELGYCLRVDHLDRGEARSLCARVRQRVDDPQTLVWLLSTSSQSADLEITPERAIEIRNRKEARLGLIVPVGVLDAAASSLTNSFAVFELDRFWKRAAQELLGNMPPELTATVQRVLKTPRGRLMLTSQQRAEYLSAVCEVPTLETVGRELWRLGLVPDLGDALIDRLEQNQKCVRELVYPARAQASAIERVHACKLRDGTVKSQLVDYLRDKRLRDSRNWLWGLAEPCCKAITFDQWSFEEGSQSDLESIEVEPLLTADGRVDPKSGFQQEGPGAQPVAPLGAKNKIKIKWSCHPKSPSNLKRWRVEVIPSRDSYTEETAPAVDLPTKPASARSRQVALPMDMKLPEDTSALGAQVRVVALDENSNELKDTNGRPIEGISQEFWIAEHEGSPPPPPSGRRATALNIPLARIEAALTLPAEELEESPGGWTERDLHYFDLRINNRFTARLALSPVLRRLEDRIINGDVLLCRATSEGHSVLDPDRDIEAVDLAALATDEVGARFLKVRHHFLAHLNKQGSRRWLETSAWSDELSQQARSYAAAYDKLLKELPAGQPLREALQVDTLQVSIEIGDHTENSVIILPTHPLRVAWYAAYADLLRSWEENLLQCEKRQRSRMLDLSLLEQVAPLNCPAFVLGGDGRPFLAVQNLRFFWGVAMPVETRNPARQVSNVARAVGLGDDESAIADLPPTKIAEELRAYQRVHRYLETLRMSVINPGGGGLIAEALRAFYTSIRTEDDGENGQEEATGVPPRLELFAHLVPPVPSSLAPLVRLQQELYEARSRGRHHHLAPFVSIALRQESEADRIPGGDVNVSLIMDRLQPKIEAFGEENVGDSCSLHGLLFRMLPRFTQDSTGARWQHRLYLPEDSPNARHPAYRTKTSPAVELQRTYLNAMGRVLESKEGVTAPAVSVELTTGEHRRLDAIHDLSDWVVTLDRFFGVEFFDGPSDDQAAALSHKYLLDYAPEFLDGLGHRMLVTTTHREEVEEILARAMRDLGFRQVEDSVGKVLHHLKTISGRLALRVLGDDSRAREAVSLGIVAAWLKAQGELADSILVPIDAHPELFGTGRKRRPREDPAARCDLMRVQFRPNRLTVTFIEVKARSRFTRSVELADRIVDQVEATEKVFQDHFFSDEPQRVDHILQRARLATILEFYLRRAIRYGMITSQETRVKMEEAIARLETGIARLRVVRWGFIVNLDGTPQRALQHRDAKIRFLTARDLTDTGLSTVVHPEPPPSTPPPREVPVSRPLTQKSTAARRPSPPAEKISGSKAVGTPTAPEDDATAKVSTSSKATESNRAKRAAAPVAAEEGSPHGSPEVPAEEVASRDPERPEVVTVELGADLDNGPVVWRASVRGSPHLFMVGIPGQGKSWATTRLLCHMARQGLPALSLDFHGQFGAPEGHYARAANPTILDASKGLPFSPFEADMDQTTRELWWGTNAFAVAEIFDYVCSLGDIQRDVVYAALRDCYLDVGFEEGQATRPPTVEEFATRLAELEEERGIRNVTPRCRPLLDFGLFRPDEQVTELSDLLKHGLIVDVHNLGLEVLQIAAGAFVLRKIYKDMFRWGATSRLRLAIVLDEAHRLARDVTLPKLMKEGRKFGIVVIVASQGLPDYHPDVVANAGTKVIFRTNFPMSKKIAGFLRPPKQLDLPAAVEQLEVGEAFVQTPEMAVCERVRMHSLER